MFSQTIYNKQKSTNVVESSVNNAFLNSTIGDKFMPRPNNQAGSQTLKHSVANKSGPKVISLLTEKVPPRMTQTTSQPFLKSKPTAASMITTTPLGSKSSLKNVYTHMVQEAASNKSKSIPPPDKKATAPPYVSKKTLTGTSNR